MRGENFRDGVLSRRPALERDPKRRAGLEMVETRKTHHARQIVDSGIGAVELGQLPLSRREVVKRFARFKQPVVMIAVSRVNRETWRKGQGRVDPVAVDEKCANGTDVPLFAAL